MAIVLSLLAAVAPLMIPVAAGVDDRSLLWLRIIGSAMILIISGLHVALGWVEIVLVGPALAQLLQPPLSTVVYKGLRIVGCLTMLTAPPGALLLVIAFWGQIRALG